jgi:hypothetical protein
VSAINRKTEQYYMAEEYKFRVEREKRESERKRIEAEGIRDFQQTVSQGISESYLRWRGIEATLQLSQSTNSKVVVIGSGRDGLPVILGGADLPAPPPAEWERRWQGKNDGPGPGGTVGENAGCGIGAGRKDTVCSLEYFVCRRPRGSPLILAAQPVGY